MTGSSECVFQCFYYHKRLTPIYSFFVSFTIIATKPKLTNKRTYVFKVLKYASSTAYFIQL